MHEICMSMCVLEGGGQQESSSIFTLVFHTGFLIEPGTLARLADQPTLVILSLPSCADLIGNCCCTLLFM